MGKYFPGHLPDCVHPSGRRKKSYRSKAAALKSARRSNRVNYDPYKCAKCEYWHLTSRKAET